MKRAAPRLGLLQLKEQIEVIAIDERLTFNQKVVRIFELDKQTSDDGNNQTPWLKEDAWQALKKEADFWETVIATIITPEEPFVYLGTRDKDDRPMFGMVEIANLLGNTTLTGEITTALRAYPVEKQQRVAQKLFVTYMRWYDKSPMSFDYLALYTRYLARTNQLVPLESTREHRDALPLKALEDLEYAFFSYLAITLTVANRGNRETGHYLFSQRKNARLFTIENGEQKVTVPTQGVITGIAKFVYKLKVMVVLSGPSDNQLVRFTLDNLANIEVITPFALPVESFEDLLVIDLDQSHRYASHIKAFVTDSTEALAAFDCALLSQVNEPNFVVDKLFVYLSGSPHHKYEPANKNQFVAGDIVILANRMITYPYRKADYYMAVLAKRYTSNPLLPWVLELRLFLYEMVGPFPTKPIVKRYKILRLDDFMSLAPGTNLREFSIIFHSESIFYVEALLQVTDAQNQSRYVVANSRLLQYAFDFKEYFQKGDVVLPRVPLTGIKDAELFELVRTKGYRVYDFFRHTQLVGYTPKYESLFYKHDYERKHSRLIFYKARDTQPGVANLILRQMSPYALSGIFPVPIGDTLGVLSVKTEALVRIGPGRVSLIVSAAPIIYRILEQESFATYEPQKFSLDVRFTEELSLGEKALVCKHCGEEGVMKDSKSGNLYCDDLCQRIYCKTNRL